MSRQPKTKPAFGAMNPDAMGKTAEQLKLEKLQREVPGFKLIPAVKPEDKFETVFRYGRWVTINKE